MHYCEVLSILINVGTFEVVISDELPGWRLLLPRPDRPWFAQFSAGPEVFREPEIRFFRVAEDSLQARIPMPGHPVGFPDDQDFSLPRSSGHHAAGRATVSRWNRDPAVPFGADRFP